MREKKNDDGSDYCVRVCLLLFFFVSGQIFWVAVLFYLNAWGLELCVVFGGVVLCV